MRGGDLRGGSPPEQGGCEMLVLTRKSEEGIIIGNDVRVVVLSIRGNRVRLGITAPSRMPITRSEIAHEGCESANQEFEAELVCGPC